MVSQRRTAKKAKEAGAGIIVDSTASSSDILSQSLPQAEGEGLEGTTSRCNATTSFTEQLRS
ncbi:unnamed protein product [Cylicocyclus nassatus]|uniref:Uncharacterized protein n=1 Tax=Cylicocyclus nassatus TaxID=53992 RepID=A0AA36GVY2_CYLNA|nr:unnamed protein product [Cylicocyclus nassatus]